jgi:hypothetical protein
MTNPIELRCRYLREAAHVLAVSSPFACASIGAARNRLLEDAKLEVPPKERDAGRRETCGACGNLMIPGWSCRVSNRTQNQNRQGKGKKTPGVSTATTTTMVYHCLRCDRKTEQVLQPQARRQLKRTKSMTTSILEIRPSKKEHEEKVPRTANANSKQRQKARKGGLQAMLEKNKSQTTSKGFDLMDFAM